MSGAIGDTVIIEIGAEGGSIKVLKRTVPSGTAEYSVQLRDQTLKFLSEDEGGSEIRLDWAWSESWPDIIKSLGRWPWPMLHPMYVHPSYWQRVLAEVEGFRRPDGQPASQSAVRRWKEACSSSMP